MHNIIALAVLAAVVTAQNSESSVASVTSSADASAATGSNSSSTTTGPVTHTVAVAKGGHTFTPDVTLAEVGDIIEFQFYPTNHSVIRAEYGYPCVPYEMVLGAGHYGFWSGWEPVDAVLDDPPKWSVRVNDTEPIFYYCGAPNSCIGYGMVGVINPNSSTSLQHQRQLAEGSTFALVPGEDWPNEGSIPSGVATTSSSPTSTAPTSPATVTATPTAAPSSKSLSTGAIAGIAIGGAAVLLLAGVAVWFCGRQSRRNSAPAPVAPAQEVNYAYNPAVASMYGKPGHMSMVSGYSMPPGYDQHGMRSPSMPTPVDPMMGQQPPLMHSGSASPNLHSASPVYGQNHIASMYSVGTHNVGPAEMEGGALMTSPRRSMDKQGVERYS